MCCVAASAGLTRASQGFGQSRHDLDSPDPRQPPLTMYVRCLERAKSEGVYLVVPPTPLRQRQFCYVCGSCEPSSLSLLSSDPKG